MQPERKRMRAEEELARERAEQVAMHALDVIVATRSEQVPTVAFESTYRACYNMTLFKDGPVLYALLVDAVRRMAMTRTFAVYDAGVRMIADCALYLEKTWVVRSGKLSVVAIADILWDSPRFRRWRRFYGVARWAGLIVRCRRAFDEVRLRPGASGAVAAAIEFRAQASRLA